MLVVIIVLVFWLSRAYAANRQVKRDLRNLAEHIEELRQHIEAMHDE